MEDEDSSDYHSAQESDDDYFTFDIEGRQPPILRLPTEIFNLIQWRMNAVTFFVSLLTCRYFLKAAASRPLVLHHLHTLPGLRLGLDDLDADQLLTEFRRRAAVGGYAAGVLANTKVFGPTPGSLMSRSVFTSHEVTYPRSTQTTLAVPHRNGFVQLYNLTQDSVHKEDELHLPLEQRTQDEMDILKVAFAPQTRDLAVLCRPADSSPCVPQFTDSFPRAHKPDLVIYKLILFHRLHSKRRGHYYFSFKNETRDVPIDSAIPASLAISSDGTACIAWKHHDNNVTWKPWLIFRNDKLMRSCSYGESKQLDLPDRGALPWLVWASILV